MPKKVDHDARKELIFKAALEVVAKNGYQDTNLQEIATLCNLSRTSVYEYFTDKKDIFTYGVKKVTERMFEQYTSPLWQKENKLEELTSIIDNVIDVINASKREITNLVLILTKMEADIYVVVKRRTAKLKLALCRIIREGIEKNQIKKRNAETTVEKIFILIESYCFQLVYLGKKNAAQTKELLDSYLSSL